MERVRGSGSHFVHPVLKVVLVDWRPIVERERLVPHDGESVDGDCEGLGHGDDAPVPTRWNVNTAVP